MSNVMLSQILTLPYASYADAQQQLADIEAIDYYLAKQLVELTILQLTDANKLNTHDVAQLFHLLLELNKMLRAGHTCLSLKNMSNRYVSRLIDSTGHVTHQGFRFDDEKQLQAIFDEIGVDETSSQPIILIQDRLYFRRYFLFEQEVVGFIRDSLSINQGTNELSLAVAKKVMAVLFDDAPKQEIDWQQVAVTNALNKRFTVIAGGPGTGKTYTVTKLLAALVMLNEDSKLDIALVAPTGKAAQRLSESIQSALTGFKGIIDDNVLDKIPTQGQTIHRLLGVIPNQVNFRHNRENPLKIDVLLIDEVSMVDLPMMARVFRALPAHCKVILLGDANQLPSVAAGSVLADLTPHKEAKYSNANALFLSKLTGFERLPKSEKHSQDYLTYLTFSRRFDGESGVGHLAKAVIKGDSQVSWSLLNDNKKGQQSNLTLLPQGQLEKLIAQAVVQYQKVMKAEDIEKAFDELNEYRILAAMRKGLYGVEQLNEQVESKLDNRGHTIFHGKPIMITTNDYNLGLFNGDIGLIWRNDSDQLMVYFEDGVGGYKQFIPARLPAFEPVYAMTIHKTQGSEFKHVAIVLPDNNDSQFLTRELLYTGITRAKIKVSVLAQRNIWNQAVEAQVNRFSGIKI